MNKIIFFRKTIHQFRSDIAKEKDKKDCDPSIVQNYMWMTEALELAVGNLRKQLTEEF